MKGDPWGALALYKDDDTQPGKGPSERGETCSAVDPFLHIDSERGHGSSKQEQASAFVHEAMQSHTYQRRLKVTGTLDEPGQPEPKWPAGRANWEDGWHTVPLLMSSLPSRVVNGSYDRGSKIPQYYLSSLENSGFIQETWAWTGIGTIRQTRWNLRERPQLCPLW